MSKKLILRWFWLYYSLLESRLQPHMVEFYNRSVLCSAAIVWWQFSFLLAENRENYIDFEDFYGFYGMMKAKQRVCTYVCEYFMTVFSNFYKPHILM